MLSKSPTGVSLLAAPDHKLQPGLLPTHLACTELIPAALQEVTAVRKRKNVGFPNSIEITWGADGKREFFTSFLSRV